MIVNRCTPDHDGKFIVNTIWFDADGKKELFGTYKEALLDTDGAPGKKVRLA